MKTTRRQFLSTAVGSATIVSLSPIVPHFLVQAAANENNSCGESILVVVQLSGGNDGLNTVIPYADDEYYRNRFTLAIGRGQVRKIDDHVGLHPAMKGFSDLLEDGKLSVVQGVGYPNPNRSHFESMDLWHTAHQVGGQRTFGWLGKYLDATSRADGRDVPAMHFGAEKQPLALNAERIRVPSIQSLERFRLEVGGNQQLRSAIEKLASAPRSESGDLLQFVQRSSAAALATSKRVEQALGNYKTEVNYPGSGLGGKLRTVAQLIDAGMSTRIYYVTLDGFDTHSNQVGAHYGLLQQLSDAASAFITDIVQHGHGDRVLLMTFSEFGRRVKENASQGTDHGAAAPMFLAGGKVRAGLIGKHPSLTDLEDGDLKFHTDYRRIYATVLDNWFGWKSDSIIGGKFDHLPLLS